MTRIKTEREIRLLDNSLERVLNSARRIAKRMMKHPDEATSELASIVVRDIEELGPLAVELWDKAREEVLKERLKNAR